MQTRDLLSIVHHNSNLGQSAPLYQKIEIENVFYLSFASILLFILLVYKRCKHGQVVRVM